MKLNLSFIKYVLDISHNEQPASGVWTLHVDV